MTKLEYGIRNYAHSTDNCCCKVATVVDGNKVKSSEQTCYASFGENKGAKFINPFKAPETRPEVAYGAVRCVYSEEHRCSAERIDTGGDEACDCAETKYGTFRTRQRCRGCRGSGISPVSMWDRRRGGRRARGDEEL